MAVLPLQYLYLCTTVSVSVSVAESKSASATASLYLGNCKGDQVSLHRWLATEFHRADFPPIFLNIRFFLGAGGFKCTRDFRSHWIKGKSKLNCPRGCADQKFTTVRVLNVAQTHRRFSLVHFPNFHPGILSAFDMANFELRVLSFGRKHPLSEMTLWLVLHNPDRQSEKSEKSGGDGSCQQD